MNEREQDAIDAILSGGDFDAVTNSLSTSEFLCVALATDHDDDLTPLYSTFGEAVKRLDSAQRALVHENRNGARYD